MTKSIYYDQFSHLSRNEHFFNRYIKLIDIFKKRNLSKAKNLENHHIFPKSFGGSDKKENLVYLHPKEHFIIHHLLWKAFPDTGMTYAFFKMNHCKKHKNKITCKVYEQIKNDHCKRTSQQMLARRKGRIIINNGKIQKKIFPEDLEIYYEKGFSEGVLPESVKKNSLSKKDKIYVNDGIINKLVSIEESYELLKTTIWKKNKVKKTNHSNETKLKLSNSRKGKFWISNENDEKFVNLEDAELIYYPKGFVNGRLSSSMNKSSNGRTGKVWINNGLENKFIFIEDLEHYISNGWKKRKIKKEKFYITNGIINKFVSLEEAETIYYPQGFFKGKKKKEIL